jgi:hypothetical protein
MGINLSKTLCLNFFKKKSSDNQPCLWLMGKLMDYKKIGKFLGVMFDKHLMLEVNVCDITTRCWKRLSLQKIYKAKGME